MIAGYASGRPVTVPYNSIKLYGPTDHHGYPLPRP